MECECTEFLKGGQTFCPRYQRVMAGRLIQICAGQADGLDERTCERYRWLWTWYGALEHTGGCVFFVAGNFHQTEVSP
jgi:hypothetical protein